jgi:hypothetical protein
MGFFGGKVMYKKLQFQSILFPYKKCATEKKRI